MKKIFSLLLSTLFVSATWAVPAQKGITKQLKLADGRTVTVSLVGDEFLRYWVDSEGNSYRIGADGIGSLIADMGELKAYAKRDRDQVSATREAKVREARSVSGYTKRKGKVKSLVIMMAFQDKDFSTPYDELTQIVNNRFNQHGYTDDHGSIGSVRDYFYDQSRGQFEVTFDVFGPFKAKNGYAYYGENAYRGVDKHATDLVREAVAAVMAANPEKSFAEYDWNNDGDVDNVVILYAGRGEATGGGENTIWPHQFALGYNGGGKMKANDRNINEYAVFNELNAKNQIDGIGTTVHEYGHLLGLPDFYDTNYTRIYGMGDWSVMDAGCYNNDAYTPVGYTAFERFYLGWQDLIELKNDTTVAGMKALQVGGEAYAMYNDNRRSEYFILENRSRTGWDAYIPGQGMLVTHVDYDEYSFRRNIVNTNKDHLRFTIVPADGVASKPQYYGEPDKFQIYDVFPFAYTDSLNNLSSPALRLHNANTDGRKLLNKSVTGIALAADTTISFNFKAKDMGVKYVPKEYDFYESFNECLSNGGNDGEFYGFVGTPSEYYPDNEGWKVEDDTPSQKDLYVGCKNSARFGRSDAPTIVVTPELVASSDADFSFRIAPYSKVSEDMFDLTLESTNPDVVLSETNFKMTAAQWNDIKVHITGKNSRFKIKIKPAKSRIFLDEVLFVNRSEVLGIRDLQNNDVKNDNRVYSIDGRYLGTSLDVLPRGLYIVNGKKVIK